jgi:hypothetical protein
MKCHLCKGDKRLRVVNGYGRKFVADGWRACSRCGGTGDEPGAMKRERRTCVHLKKHGCPENCHRETLPHWSPSHPLPLPDNVLVLLVHRGEGPLYAVAIDVDARLYPAWTLAGYRVPVERAAEFARGLK